MKKKLYIGALFILVLFIGCALIPKNLTPFEQAQEQVQRMMDAYIIVYDRTTEMASDPNITEAERVLVRANVRILSEVWPALIRCMVFLKEGKIPLSIDLSTAGSILDLIEEVAL